MPRFAVVAMSMGAEYLVGRNRVLARPLPPYAPVVCEFLGELSAELLGNTVASRYPDIATFAFWIRKANIKKLRLDFEGGRQRIGRGIAFHITPSNVPINFAVSYVFGLLSGNANIVRVPSTTFPHVDIVCAAMRRLFEEVRFSEVASMTAFVKYGRDDEITRDLSVQCAARIVWGGDETIRNIRKFPVPHRAVEVCFSDRYSFCVMDSSAVLALSEAELSRLVDQFYNDTYLMDQNACSSPHLVVWRGGNREGAQRRFWSALSEVVVRRYRLEPITVVDKFTLLCKNAIDTAVAAPVERYGNALYRSALLRLPEQLDLLRGQFGLFYEFDAESLDVLAPLINSKYQTVTYFGVSKTELANFVMRNQLLGIDRIVPVGKALDIDVVWDGYDIVAALSRIVDIR